MRSIAYMGVLAALLFATIAAAPAQELAQAIDRTPTPKITTEQASEIALKLVPGRVTSVVIERKRGKNVYVVEIMTKSDGEKDVFVDIETGRVVGTD
jgi:uncharacterized membrane protein YkoI